MLLVHKLIQIIHTISSKAYGLKWLCVIQSHWLKGTQMWFGVQDIYNNFAH